MAKLVSNAPKLIAAALTVLAALAACSSDDDSSIDRAKLAQKCFIDSDCNEPLRCAFQKCHVQCETSRDCTDIAPDARCVISNRPFNVCQLPEERNCKFNSECPEGQRCAIDEQCRDQCRSDRDCVSGQKCITGTCAEPTELTPTGQLKPANDASTNDGQPCSYNSDCSPPLACRNGTCSFQCKADVDCGRNERCTGNVCVLAPEDGGTCIPVTCASVNKNCGALTDNCGGIAKCGTGTGAGDCKSDETCGAAGPNLCGKGSCNPLTCALAGKNCGLLSDGCSGVLNCGTCAGGQTCGGGGTTNVCGCTPDNAKACAGKDCGPVVNNCGQTVDCGACGTPKTCGGGGAANKCGCTAKTCAQLGKNCGQVDDGCGATITCGNCAGGQTCGGGGTNNVCGAGSCTPTDCVAQGRNCGPVSDGCGAVLSCGNCGAGTSCGGSGTPNVCGCTPKTCAQLGRNCGPVGDACGASLYCGDCSGLQSCGGAGATGQCGCTPTTCAAANKNCGVIADGCGSIIACGACPSGQTCGGGGIPNTCAPPGAAKSCQGSPLRCGPTRTDDCCATATVTGGLFNRKNDSVDPLFKYPARVSSFKLDIYEVTIGRFRTYLGSPNNYAYRGSPPPAGAGANTSIAAGTSTGWDPAWNSELPVDFADMDARLKCGSHRWTSVAGQEETVPIGCLDWYAAFAFCAWDGGRLPTENEIQYAWAGGAEHRTWPWSSNVTPTCSYDDNSCGGPLPAGSAPLGAGKWGQRNLVGGMREWAFDYFRDPFRYGDCTAVDCTDSVNQSGSRVMHGGDWGGFQGSRDYRDYGGPTGRAYYFGVRCARNQ